MKQKQFIKELIAVIDRFKPSPEELRYALKVVRKQTGLRVAKRSKPLPKYYVPAEIYGLLDASRKISPSHALLAEILFQTGLRISELQALDLRDIDAEGNTLLVRNGKGGKDRIVPLTSRLYNDIRTYCRSKDGQLRNTGQIFLKKNYKPVSVRTLEHWWAESCRTAGITGKGKTGPHAARHTFACILVNKGFALEDVQRILGHEHRITTEVYAKIAFTPELKSRYLALFESGIV